MHALPQELYTWDSDKKTPQAGNQYSIFRSIDDAAKKLEIDLSKEDITSSENFDEETQLPANGVLIHNE